MQGVVGYVVGIMDMYNCLCTGKISAANTAVHLKQVMCKICCLLRWKDLRSSCNNTKQDCSSFSLHASSWTGCLQGRPVHLWTLLCQPYPPGLLPIVMIDYFSS